MERASILCDHSEIQLEHLVSPLPGSTHQPSSTEITTLAAAEKAHLEHALQQCPDDNSALARQLGISERTLYRKLKKLQT
ncbi:MAG: helix-turn-helix domain-containing protein [Pseudomonadota bacterium]